MRNFNNSPSVTIQTVAAAANGTTLDAGYDVDIRYSFTLVSTGSLSGAQTGYLVLEICSNNSSNAGDWIEISRTPNGSAVSLAIALSSTNTGGGQVSGILPTGWFYRVRSVITAGNPTFNYNSGQEVTLDN